MRILTPSGYRDIAGCREGDPVCAFDGDGGTPIVNYIKRIERWQPWLDGLYSWNCADDSEIGPQFSPWKFYLVNGKYTLFGEQSIWRNGTNVCHVRDLVLGDTIYDDADNPIVIVGFGETAAPDVWSRFEISGDHSYIVDGLTLHNASRFAVNAGAVNWTWDLSATTHWASVTNGSSGASAPGSADAVTFDGSSGGHVVTPSYGGTGTFQSITCGAFTGTLDFSANNNSVTLNAIAGFSGSGAGTRTINLGNGTWSLTATAGGTPWNMATTTGLTFNANSSTIDFAALASGSQTFASGGLTYSTVKISGARAGKLWVHGGGGTIGTLSIAASVTIDISAACTLTNLAVSSSGPVVIALPGGVTTTITNAYSLTGSASAPIAIINQGGITTSVGTLSITSGVASVSYGVFEGITFSGGATFTGTNSYDLGRNTGITITAPSAGAAGMLYIPSLEGP